MTYDPRIATVTRAEFDELMAIVRTPQKEALTDEDRWRRDYQAEQERRRIVRLQHDLFAAKPVTLYHRHRAAPSWDRPPDETIEAKLQRIAGDRLATFGPERIDRPLILTADERAAIAARAANRRTLLAIGRDQPRPKGPALDPRRVPDDRLDHLIQSHRDLAVVEALRAERQRRAIAGGLLPSTHGDDHG